MPTILKPDGLTDFFILYQISLWALKYFIYSSQLVHICRLTFKKKYKHGKWVQCFQAKRVICNHCSGSTEIVLWAVHNFKWSSASPKGCHVEPHTLTSMDASIPSRQLIRKHLHTYDKIAQHGTRWGQPGHAVSPWLTFIFETHIVVNWQLSKEGICWPVSHDHIMGSSEELIKFTYSFEVDQWSGDSFYWITSKPAKNVF